jgi:hypothetical protein
MTVGWENRHQEAYSDSAAEKQNLILSSKSEPIRRRDGFQGDLDKCLGLKYKLWLIIVCVFALLLSLRRIK